MQVTNDDAKDAMSDDASEPAQLCSRCSQIDILNYFRAGPYLEYDEALSFDDKYVLNNLRDVLANTACNFCCLVVAALRNRDPKSFEFLESKSGPGKVITVYMACVRLSKDQLMNRIVAEAPAMAIYTDAYNTNAATCNRGWIRLSADDAHLLGHQGYNCGRVIGRDIAPELVCNWLATCTEHHQVCRATRMYWDSQYMSVRSIRVIDTKEMRIRKSVSFKYSTEYMSLSYVWGQGHTGLQLTKENHAQLTQPGSLSEKWHLIPKVIQDAIEFVRSMETHVIGRVFREKKAQKTGRLFLWVDQLCIMQDDPEDKRVQIQQMDKIYRGGLATIIANDGTHANEPLPRTKQDIEHHTAELPPFHGQVARKVHGVNMIAALPILDDVVRGGRWATRGWTLQESQLSERSIAFTKSQVYFKCDSTVYCEDLEPKFADLDVDSLTSTSYHVRNGMPRDAHASTWPNNFAAYLRLVEDYSSRTLGSQGDIANAFRGIAYSFQMISRWNITNGLVPTVMDFSLLWRPKKPDLTRRFHNNGDPNSPSRTSSYEVDNLPTFSWMAWCGAVTFDRTYDSSGFKSLIKSFSTLTPEDKSPRLSPRESQKPLISTALPRRGEFTLEPVPPFAPADVSTLQTFGLAAQDFGMSIPGALNRLHLSSKPSAKVDDGPCMLIFKATHVRLRLVDSSEYRNRPGEDCSDDSAAVGRVSLYDHQGKQAGFCWDTLPLKAFLNNEVDVICLSKSKSDNNASDERFFDTSAYEWNEWCLINVMVIKILPDGKAERLTIGKIHEKCAEGANEIQVNLV